MARQPFGSSTGNVRPIVPISGTSRRRRGGGGGSGTAAAGKPKSKDLDWESAAPKNNNRPELSASTKTTAVNSTTTSNNNANRRSKFKSSAISSAAAGFGTSSSSTLEAAARHYDNDDESAILSASSAGGSSNDGGRMRGRVGHGNGDGDDNGSNDSPATNATIASRTGGAHRRDGDDGRVLWKQMRMDQHRKKRQLQEQQMEQQRQHRQQKRSKGGDGRPPLPPPPGSQRRLAGRSQSSTTSSSKFDSHNAKTPKITNRQDRSKMKMKINMGQQQQTQQIHQQQPGTSLSNARTPSKPRIVGRTEPLESSASAKKNKIKDAGIGIGIGLTTTNSSRRRRSIEIYEDPPVPSIEAGGVSIHERQNVNGAAGKSTSSLASAASTLATTAAAAAAHKRAPRPSFLPPRPPGLGESPLVPPLPALNAPSAPGPVPAASSKKSTSHHSPDEMDCSPDVHGLGLSSSGSEENSGGSNPDDDSPELRDRIAAAAARGRMTAVTTTSTTTATPAASAGEEVDGSGTGGGKPRFAFRSPDTVTKRKEEDKKTVAEVEAAKLSQGFHPPHSTTSAHRPVTRDDLDRARRSEPENGRVMAALLRSHDGRSNAHRPSDVDDNSQAVASRSTAFNSIALVGAVVGGQELRRSHSLDESEMTAHTQGYIRQQQRREGSVVPPSMASHDRTTRSMADVDDEADDYTSVASEDSTEEKLAFIQDQLPPGWEIRLSRSKGKPYYRHPDFGQTWYCPVKIDYDRFSPRTPLTPTTASESDASYESPASVTALRDDGSHTSPPGSEPYGGRFDGDRDITGRLSSNAFDDGPVPATEERVEVVDKHGHRQNSDLRKEPVTNGTVVDDLNQSFSPESAVDDLGHGKDKAGGVLAMGDDRNADDNQTCAGDDGYRQDQMSNTTNDAGDGNDVGFLETRVDDTSAEHGQEGRSGQSPSVSVISTLGFASRKGLAKLLDQVTGEHPNNTASPFEQDTSSSTEPGGKPAADDIIYDGNDDNGGSPLADDEEEDEAQMDPTLSPTLLSPQRENRKSVCASPTDSLNLMDVDNDRDIDEKGNDDEARASSQEKLHEGGNQDNVESEDDDDNNGGFPLGDFEDDDQTDSPSSPSILKHEDGKENVVGAVKMESRQVENGTGGFIEEIEIDSSDDDALSSIHMGELPIKRDHHANSASSRVYNDDASLGSWRTLCGPDRPRCSLQNINVLLKEQHNLRKNRRNTSTGGTKKKRTKRSKAGPSGEKNKSSKKKSRVKLEA